MINDDNSLDKLVLVKLDKKDYDYIQELVDDGLYSSHSEFISGAVKSKLDSFDEIILRDIPYAQQKEEVSNYMKTHGKVDAIEIADALLLDVFEIIDIISELIKEGKVEEV